MNDESSTELEKSVGIKYSELTEEEKEAVDRIKYGYHLLSTRERKGSPTDIIKDLSVTIAAEMRRAAERAVEEYEAAHDPRSRD